MDTNGLPSQEVQQAILEAFKKDDVEYLKQIIGIKPTESTRFFLWDLTLVYAPNKISAYLRENKIYKIREIKSKLVNISNQFRHACAEGNLELIQELINSGIDFYQFNPTYFYIAILHNQLIVADYLLKNGSAHIDKNPLIFPRYIAQATEYLPDTHLDQEYVDQAQATIKTAQFMLDLGYDINTIVSRGVNPTGYTALNVALFNYRIGMWTVAPVAAFLYEKGAKLLQEIKPDLPLSYGAFWTLEQWKEIISDAIQTSLNPPEPYKWEE